MKKLEIEMPDNIDCMIIAYLETVSVGNINVGQRCVGRHDLNAGKIVEEDIHSAMPLIERIKSVIIEVIEELDPPPEDEIIVTKNGIAMMNVETFHELTNGQYRNAVGMLRTKDGPVRKEEKE